MGDLSRARRIASPADAACPVADPVKRYIDLGWLLTRGNVFEKPLTAEARACIESVRTRLWRSMTPAQRLTVAVAEERLKGRKPFVPVVSVKDAKEVRS